MQALKGQRDERQSDGAPGMGPERGHTVPEEALIRRLTRERLLARDRLDIPSGGAMSLWGFEDVSPAE